MRNASGVFFIILAIVLAYGALLNLQNFIANARYGLSASEIELGQILPRLLAFCLFGFLSFKLFKLGIKRIASNATKDADLKEVE